MKACFIGMGRILFLPMMMNFEELPEYKKDHKRLNKKHRTLLDDIILFKEHVIENPTRPVGISAIIYTEQLFCIVKSRLACRALPRKSLRVIYAYISQENRVDFIELYSKSDKDREDQERIEQYKRDFWEKHQG